MVVLTILIGSISVSPQIAAQEDEIGRVREVIYGFPGSNLLLEYYLHWVPDYEYDNFVIANLTCSFTDLDPGHYVEIQILNARLTERIEGGIWGWMSGQVIENLTHSLADNFRFYNFVRETIPIFVTSQVQYDGNNSLFFDLDVSVEQYDENSEPVGTLTNVWDNNVGDEDCPIVDLSGQIPPSLSSTVTTTTITGPASVFTLFDLALLLLIILCMILIVFFTSRTAVHLYRKRESEEDEVE